MRYPRSRRATMLVTIAAGIVVSAGTLAWPGSGALGSQPPQDPLAEPFKGVTTNRTVVKDLFPVRRTGVSTAPVRRAADRFIASLTPAQRTRTSFPLDDAEWRKWNNVHRYTRQGVNFREMSETQREAAFTLLRTSLSARGFEQSRNVMRLNGYLAELVKNFEEYGEDLYHLTVMGAPSETEPWGWQLDGHHLIINYFVLGDQVVMTPSFAGSEPVSVTEGKYAGTSVLQDEQNAGHAFFTSLTDAQRRTATIEPTKTRNNSLAQAFRDNLVLGYAGLRGDALTAPQQQKLLSLIGLYVGAMPEGHAKVRMDEVRAHLGETRFAWIGGSEADGVFYYRIQSPVVLIEFDHQTPVAIGTRGGPPTRQHIHSVVRTPNGNDYGKDLLRQHYLSHPHP
jgi:hypothetical protein